MRLFGRKRKTKEDGEVKREDLGLRTPVTAFDRAQTAYFEMFGAAAVRNRQYLALAGGLLILNIVQAVAIVGLFPLKTLEVWRIDVDSETHEAKGVKVTGMASKPLREDYQYWIGKFATRLFTLDRATTVPELREAYKWMIAGPKAQSQFSEFLDKYKPVQTLNDSPTTTADVTVDSINFSEGNAAQIKLYVKTRNPGNPNGETVVRWLSVHWEIYAPKTNEDILHNPHGIYFTHMSVSEQVAK